VESGCCGWGNRRTSCWLLSPSDDISLANGGSRGPRAERSTARSRPPAVGTCFKLASDERAGVTGLNRPGIRRIVSTGNSNGHCHRLPPLIRWGTWVSLWLHHSISAGWLWSSLKKNQSSDNLYHMTSKSNPLVSYTCSPELLGPIHFQLNKLWYTRKKFVSLADKRNQEAFL
jgi:hypothetical protein